MNNDIRKRAVKELRKPIGIFSRSTLVNVLLVGFILMDAVCIYTLWNKIITDNPVMLVMIAASCAAILDIPMSVAGTVLKQGSQGLCSRKAARIIALGCLATFLTVFVFMLLLRIDTKDLTITAGQSASGLVDLTETEAADETNPVALLGSVTLGILPAATSAASFLVSYAVSDPLSDKISDFETMRIELQEDLGVKQAALVEAEDTRAYLNALLDHEAAAYESAKQQARSIGNKMEQIARLEIMKKLGDPDGISSVTESGAAINERYAQNRSGFETEAA